MSHRFHCRQDEKPARSGGEALPRLCIEEERLDRERGLLFVRGWAIGSDGARLAFFDHKRRRLPAKLTRTLRPDVEEAYPEAKKSEKWGFAAELALAEVPGKQVYLVCVSGDGRSVQRIGISAAASVRRRAERVLAKGMRYWRANGTRAMAVKVGRKLSRADRPVNYQRWLRRHLPDQKELERQRSTRFPISPKFSIVVPLYRTPKDYLLRMIRSVQDQTYGNFELLLSDGSGADSPIPAFLSEVLKRDARIRLIPHDRALRISENTNEAISRASGDYLVFLDHDDELTPNALFACAEAINRSPEARVLYSDEDKVSMDGKHFFEPAMKPDFNPDLLCTVNYISHLFVAEAGLVREAGPLREAFDGAQDYDLIFRCTELAGEKGICHIPRILYHWRSHENSTAENPESKAYAFEAGRRAVEAHYERLGIPAEVRHGEYPGLYRTRFLWKEKPLVSVLIPNKDHAEDLRRCIASVEEQSTYRNLEYIIIENNSEEEETFAFYEELCRENSRVRVIRCEGGFNFSAINNFGVRHAAGAYLLFLNNDTEMIGEDCIGELLGYAMRPDVGAVGARLYYGDNTVQHAGVVVGFGGIAGHCFVQQPREATGYCHRIISAQDYSAVTAACMMVRREAFEEVGGFTEELAVAFNDIDLCMKLGERGYHIVYNPYAELYHYESKSRGLEDTPEKLERFQREIALFRSRWPEIVEKGDPYYSPNLTLDSQDFSLKRLERKRE